uniref:hypothetical protein n=1 Tax=Streptococcus orisratti TaxID=114652 RepID=UPI0014617070
VKKLQEAFQNLENKTDINVPSDPQYLKGFTEWGTPNYDWPPKLGFQEETIQGIIRESGLPETWDRYGYMGGGNFSDVPASGPYSYSERSIPYLENPDAYHTGTFNRETYFDKIDAIKDGNLNKLNGILESEGINSITEGKFNRLISDYNYFLDNAASQLNISPNDITYGIHGKAASWGDMSGGAEQIVTPFNGQTMNELGIQKEVFK